MSFKVKYLFLDPGVKNIGLCLLNYRTGKIQFKSTTIGFDTEPYIDTQPLDALIKDVDRPVYMFSEKNVFPQNPDFNQKIGVVIAAIECWLIVNFKLGSGDFTHVRVMPVHVAKFFNLPKDRHDKKLIMMDPFYKTLGVKHKFTNHEVDAFATGACYILRNSNQYSKDLVKTCETFKRYVDEASQLYHAKSDATKANFSPPVLPRRRKACEDNSAPDHTDSSSCVSHCNRPAYDPTEV
jgi:hypothetical protein